VVDLEAADLEHMQVPLELLAKETRVVVQLILHTKAVVVEPVRLVVAQVLLLVLVLEALVKIQIQLGRLQHQLEQAVITLVAEAEDTIAQ
jgi:hypothetical protein